MFYLFLGIIFINLFLYYKKYVFLLLLIVCLYKLGKKINIKLYIVCCFIISLFFTTNINHYKKENKNNVIIENLKVLESYQNYSIVGKNKTKFLIYNKENNFQEGNEIFFKGELIDITNDFNTFHKYLNKQNVHYELQYSQFAIISSNVKSNVLIVNKLLKNKSEPSKSYLKLILFNIKDDANKELYNTFSIYSLTYLICISGFHINLLLAFFKKVFHNNAFSISIVVFYLYLLDFTISSYRAFLCYVFKKLNKKLNFNLSNFDVISLIGVVLILINPNIMFSLSFIYSFLATLALEIFKLYKSNKILIPFYIYLINLPLLLISNYKLNLATVIFGMILGTPVSILYILSFLFLFLDKLFMIHKLYINLLFNLFSILENFNISFILGKPSVPFIILYYLFLSLIFIAKERKRKTKYIYSLSLILLLFYQYYKPILTYNEQIYFLNVGQGDSTVFFIPHSKEVVLIDTGGSTYKDIATTEIIPFLEEKGINKIKTILITHDDFDHMGALNSLKSNFNIEQIIDTSLIDQLKIGTKTFKNLNINSNRDNDGSAVLYGKYGGLNILLMGDASSKIESSIKEYIKDVDIIKIAHHGSNSSSNYEFLKKINGKVAIISVGKNNIYNHPHKEVVERLKELGYTILRTDENNDIGFGINLFNLSFVDYFN